MLFFYIFAPIFNLKQYDNEKSITFNLYGECSIRYVILRFDKRSRFFIIFKW